MQNDIEGVTRSTSEKITNTSLLQKLEKHASLLVIAGLMSGICAKALDITDTNHNPELNETPAQAPIVPQEVPATPTQYSSAVNRIDETKKLILEIDQNSTTALDTQKMWVGTSSSAMVTQAQVPKIIKNERLYSLGLKHVVCRDRYVSYPQHNCYNRHFGEFPSIPAGKSLPTLTEITFTEINANGRKKTNGDKVVLAFNSERVELQMFIGASPHTVRNRLAPNTRSYVRVELNSSTNPPAATSSAPCLDPYGGGSICQPADSDDFDPSLFFPPPRLDYYSKDYTFLDKQLTEINQTLKAARDAIIASQSATNRQHQKRF